MNRYRIIGVFSVSGWIGAFVLRRFVRAHFEAGAASAQDMFFKGKTLTILSPSTAGGSYDFYARYMSEYLPGKPNTSCRTCPVPAA